MFKSILFRGQEYKPLPTDPVFIKDLNLDQIISAVLSLNPDNELRQLFMTPLNTAEDIRYRHDVWKDLSDIRLKAIVDDFIIQMQKFRNEQACQKSLGNQHQVQYSFICGVLIFCEAVARLSEGLLPLELQSDGLIAFREYLNGYVSSEDFIKLHEEAVELLEDLKSINYSLRIRSRSIQVLEHDKNQENFSEEIKAFFSKFPAKSSKSFVSLKSTDDITDVELNVLRLVSYLFPEIFDKLNRFCDLNKNFLPNAVETFEREIEFYTSWLEFTKPLLEKGNSFTLPILSADEKDEDVRSCYDLALVCKTLQDDYRVVPNNYFLKKPERTIVVTGPNQGGKTTFARMFGQIHYLASLGLTVPAGYAKLFLPDRIFTHFEREESQKTGKLQDDLKRLEYILEQSTSRSLIIVNEIFSTATLGDAEHLARNMLDKIHKLDSLCVCVTFIDKLADPHEKTVSMVSTVIPGEPNSRTFRLERKPADGIAYAQAIAERHDLSYNRIRERISI